MEIGTTISAWKFDEKNKEIKRNKSKNTQKNHLKIRISVNGFLK